MVIAVDKNQFIGSHGKSNAKKHKQMEKCGVVLLPIPLPFGDYCLVTDEMQKIINEKGEKLKKKDLESVIKISIDTKKDLQELFGNVRTGQHERFKKELNKPIDNNSKLIILCEHSSDVTCMEDVYFFYQPEIERIKWTTKKICGKQVKVSEKYMQKEMKGISLFRSLQTIQDRYNVDFVFCNKNETGKKIIEILGGTYDS